jgi:ADP-ribosylglycohydrolase
MLVHTRQLRRLITRVIENKREQGHVTERLDDRLAALPDSYDALLTFADELADLPLRDDWPHHEPSDWAGIVAEMASDRPTRAIRAVAADDAAARIEAAFLGSVCGCILGKPLEIMPTLTELREALERIGDWPLNDYVSRRIGEEGGLREVHESGRYTYRENIRWVAPDDDINYTILGMLMLEDHGVGFTHQQMCATWLRQLSPGWTWGPERTMLLRAAADTLAEPGRDFDRWVRVLNPGDELCGAMIRADAYGYACPGNPMLAAELAWRDASWTHRRNGIYGTMFAAAAIAVAPVARDPLEIFDIALRFVPQRSRFAAIVSDAVAIVRDADDWLSAYEAIHDRYGAYGHCRVFQESATLVNTLRFAQDIGHGICLQVMQGNDTDSYGATVGSILGAYFGPGHLDPRWLAPFHDTIHTTLADFHEQSLSGLAQRMSRLPQLTA